MSRPAHGRAPGVATDPPARPDDARTRWTREGGFVAGGETLLLGSLVFVTGILLVVNAWNVVDAHQAADAVAREVARTLVEADPGPGLSGDLDRVAADTIAAMDRDGPVRLEVRDAAGHAVGDPSAALARCARLAVQATITVDTVRLPFVGGWGRAWTITGQHHEVVDPYRSGLAGEVDCGT